MKKVNKEMKLLKNEDFCSLIESLDLQKVCRICLLNPDKNSELELPGLSPKKWEFYKKCKIVMFNTMELNDILEVLTRELLRAPKEVDAKVFIFDGLISTFSISYSNIIDRKRIEFVNFNFQKVYMILMKLQQLEEYYEEVYINDSEEIFEIISNIYIPVKESNSWEELILQLDNDEINEDDFQNLKYVIQSFIQ